MKKTLRGGIIILLCIGMLLALSSCRLEDSYSEFYIENITDNSIDDYFSSEKCSFARLQDVVFIPEVKAVNHGEYIVYVSAYSQSEKEKVLINNVLFKEKETVLLNLETDKTIELNQNEEGLYEGWIDGGTFTSDSSKVENGKEYELVIGVEVIDSGVHVSKNITYEIVVKVYKSLVCPT